jgi:hypothetical protein
MVRTYDDPMKQEARTRLLEFILAELSFRRPRDMMVLCLPGAEELGKEALEVKEVYDRIGIPRKNIIGLEIDNERADRLRAAQLGIQVVGSSDLDFFRTTGKRFDIISLDYTGWQGKAELESLALIAGKHLLRNGGVLCTNYAARRESDAFKRELLLRMGSFNIDEWRRLAGEGSKNVHLLSREYTREYTRMAAQDTLEGIDLDYIRDAISYTTREYLARGSFAHVYAGDDPQRFVPRIIKQLSYYDQLHEMLREKRVSAIGTPASDLPKKAYMLAGRIRTDDEWREFLEQPERMGGGYIDEFAKLFGHAFSPQFEMSEDITSGVLWAMCDRETQPYIAKSVQRYSYVSNKNYLMLTDMFAVAQLKRMGDSLDTLMRFDPAELAIELNPRKVSGPVIEGAWDAMVDEIRAVHSPAPLPARQFLGSSWIMPKRKERISKADALDLLRAGCTPAEIAECYAGVTEGTLRAYKAHLKMGTYSL